MSLIPENGLAPREDDEGLFVRDIGGQLVRLDPPTDEDYHQAIQVQVDGHPVQVPKAQPLKDAQGNIVLDIEGRTTPRFTTILDAVLTLNKQLAATKTEVSIPTLCHQAHMNPVAVCRLCVVQIYDKNDRRERKLLPACQHQVAEDMKIFTINDTGRDGQNVKKTVRLLIELLANDHLKPAPAPAPEAELSPHNELGLMADHFEIKQSRFSLDLFARATEGTSAAPGSSPGSALDASSRVFLIDRSACILCGRCSRACDEVKGNNVIGRFGKGPTARIGFDLDVSMHDSTCVQCGECMVSCPTSAITFLPVGRVDSGASAPGEAISIAELQQDDLFAGIPPKFLLWQKNLVVRRRLSPGAVLARQGEPGHSAYILKSGELDVTVWPSARGNPAGNSALRQGSSVQPLLRESRTAQEDVILGEMACLSGTPRSADITARTESEVWEVRRNVLDRMMRSPNQRELFEKLYRKRALATALQNSELLRDLPPNDQSQCIELLAPLLEFVRVSPGQTIFRQGEAADKLYLVRLGHVRVGINSHGREVSVRYRGPGSVLGEIGLLAIRPQDVGKSVDEIDRILSGYPSLPVGQRTATCSALDHLELARIDRDTFLELTVRFPALRRSLIALALQRLQSSDVPFMRDFVEQGLYQAQSLLALDLDRCTRCDECTKACIDQHKTESHGYLLTRLLREGLRFGNFLVATSCRSCKDPYCMIGCPVDAIHRGKHLQIVIEDHCIGCGLCARNCPYGNISMPINKRGLLAGEEPRPKASTCDLCDAAGKEDHPIPRCVHACPHDAAKRMTGDELLAKVSHRDYNPASV